MSGGAATAATDVVVAREYGRTVPDRFGGTYVSGDRLLVFFTDDLEAHARELASRLGAPSRCEVLPCRVPWRELRAAMLRVKAAVVDRPDLGVREIGFAFRRGVLVTRVQLQRVTPERVRALRDAVAPDDVGIDPIGHHVLR